MKMEGRDFHAFHSVPRPPTISTFRSLAKGQSSKVINHHPLLHAFRSKHPLTSMNCVRTWPSLYRGIRVRLAMLQGQGHCGKLRPLAFLWRRLQCVDDGGTTHFERKVCQSCTGNGRSYVAQRISFAYAFYGTKTQTAFRTQIRKLWTLRKGVSSVFNEVK